MYPALVEVDSDNSGQTGASGPANGITVSRNSTANIINNTIQHNPSSGIQLQHNSSAQIGFAGPPGNRVSAPNTIENNGGPGISACTITGNAGDGIRGMRNAGVALGTDATGATPQFDDDTNTGTNGGFGVRCRLDGFVDGRLGTLTGVAGGKSFAESCVDSVLP